MSEQKSMVPLGSIATLSEYLQSYGPALAERAIKSLAPLHTPGLNPLPSFSDYKRKPYEAQAHLAIAAGKMFDAYGSGFICGEMGVGKTIASIVAIHEHAKRGGSDPRPYRAYVVCPDHLIKKWKREIEKTIHDVDVHIFAGKEKQWWNFLSLVPEPTGNLSRKRWDKPARPTWVVLGKNQSKRESGKQAVSASKRFLIEGEGDEPNEVVKRIVCPKCGCVPTEKGKPIAAAKIERAALCCRTLILEQLDVEHGDGRDVLVKGYRDPAMRFPEEHRNAKPGQIVSHGGKKWLAKECGEPLYQYTNKPYWYPPAKIIHKKLRKWADYLIIDEAHEQQSMTTDQSMACSKLIASTKYALALTGTFINGKAMSLFPLFMRMCVPEMQARGFEWSNKDLEEFSEKYGMVDRVVTNKTAVQAQGKIGGRGMGKAKLGDSKTEYPPRPGIMPNLFTEVVMGRTMFLTLKQFVNNLPGYSETPVGVDLPPDIQNAYSWVEASLKKENAALMSAGNMKLMGTMLHTLLGYPDSPWEWPSMFPGEVDERTGQPYHSVGWWIEKDVLTKENFVGVVSPQEFSPMDILPKERLLVDMCKENTLKGDQTWVYVQMTGKRDIQPRLKGLLEAEGMRVGILRAGDAEVVDREQWIVEHGSEFDVCISFPDLVATGMDLFDFDEGNHNFNHLIFYQCGYKLSVLRQAKRRAWRLGQPKDCTVHFFYYKGTSQELALNLMGLKEAAADLLEKGEVSDEGLSALGGGGNEQGALVKALGSSVDSSLIQRNWSKIQSRPKGLMTEVTLKPENAEGHAKAEELMAEVEDEHRRVLFEGEVPKPKFTITPSEIVKGVYVPVGDEDAIDAEAADAALADAEENGTLSWEELKTQLAPKPVQPVTPEDDDPELAAAIQRMRAWVEESKKPTGPKLHVPSEEPAAEEDDPITRMFKTLSKKAKENDDWDW